MRDLALQFYKKGYNCSQCILKAAEAAYKIPISKQMLDSCSGVKVGFGIGSTCSVLVGGIMVFGMLFDEATTKRLRIKLLDEFSRTYGQVNCPMLKKKSNGRCDGLVYEIAGLVDDIIQDELGMN